MTQSPDILFSDDDYDRLADLLDACSKFDVDALLGLLHAVAVAPSLLTPAAWLHALISKDRKALAEGEFETLVDLVLRLYSDVTGLLDKGGVIVPNSDDLDGCASFATGFVAGAQLDSSWIGNADRWTFASPLAYIAGQRDLVPDPQLQNLDADPGASALIRSNIGSIVVAADQSFKKFRLASFPSFPAGQLQRLARPMPVPALRPARVGRNDPCPCGSGKKYKRCCAA